jgi:lysylphosphatidylglycerol synthetase-like protein (DUF2156 family)
MNPGYELKTNIKDEKQLEQDDIKYPLQQPSNKSSMPTIAGILLIFAGIFAIIFWVQFLTIDATTLESIIDISQFQQIDPSITNEQIIAFLNTCAIIGCIISIFPILGGILAIKRKLWGIALAGSIIGLFSLGMLLTSSVLSFIALILLIISRKEFQ